MGHGVGTIPLLDIAQDPIPDESSSRHDLCLLRSRSEAPPPLLAGLPPHRSAMCANLCFHEEVAIRSRTDYFQHIVSLEAYCDEQSMLFPMSTYPKHRRVVVRHLKSANARASSQRANPLIGHLSSATGRVKYLDKTMSLVPVSRTPYGTLRSF